MTVVSVDNRCPQFATSFVLVQLLIVDGGCKGAGGNPVCTARQLGTHGPPLQLVAAGAKDMSVECCQKVVTEARLVAGLCRRLHE